MAIIRLRQLAWFVGLWAAGVAAVGAVVAAAAALARVAPRPASRPRRARRRGWRAAPRRRRRPWRYSISSWISGCTRSIRYSRALLTSSAARTSRSPARPAPPRPSRAERPRHRRREQAEPALVAEALLAPPDDRDSRQAKPSRARIGLALHAGSLAARRERGISGRSRSGASARRESPAPAGARASGSTRS